MDEFYDEYAYYPAWESEAWDDDYEDDWFSDAGAFDYGRLNELEAHMDRLFANPPPPPIYLPPEPVEEPEQVPDEYEYESGPDLSTEEGRRQAVVEMLAQEGKL